MVRRMTWAFTWYMTCAWNWSVVRMAFTASFTVARSDSGNT